MNPDGFGADVVRGTGWFGRDFTGLRVAVLGPGRDAAVIVPEVLRTADSVTVFQEEPDWVVPVRLPGGRAVNIAAARAFLRSRVADPWLRRLLTPQTPGRAVVASLGYYPALQGPRCRLLAWPVYAIVPGGVRTVAGVEHRADCLVVGAHSALDEASTVDAQRGAPV